MLSDVLGVLIAFVSIILLLSIVVTGMVQATQAVFRVRGRNLLASVTRFLEATNRLNAGDTRLQKRARAAAVLNSGNVASIDKVAKPDKFWRRELLGPTVSWVHSQELAAAIEKIAPVLSDTERSEDKKPPDDKSPDAASSEAKTEASPPATKKALNDDMPPPAPKTDNLVNEIRRMEPAWCKRFQFFMRMVTIGWAFVIAIGFQVSAPALFASLSTDPKRVADILEEQEEISKIAKAAIADEQYDLVSDKALDELARNHPDYADDIAQAGNAAPTKAELMSQLQDVLPDVPERPQMMREYSELIDGLITDEVPASTNNTETTDAAVDKLAAFGIGWWKDGRAFYFDSENNLKISVAIGVLLTAILLTFGAPFWFEQLRTLAALRDPRAAAASRRREQEERDKDRTLDVEMDVKVTDQKKQPQT